VTVHARPGATLFSACRQLFSSYPLAVTPSGADGGYRSMVLLHGAAGPASFFVLTQARDDLFVRRVVEPGHGLGEVAQGLLLDRLGAGCEPRVPGSGGGELPALFQVARRARPAGVPVGVLLDGEVPGVPGVAAVVPQHRFLGGCGVEPVPGHANTLSDGADISGGVKRRFVPGLKAGVSTPQFR
jgi:hypothetical protein